MPNGTGNIKIELPTRREILDQIEKCKYAALQYAKRFGLTVNKQSVSCQVPPYIPRVPKQTSIETEIGSEYLYEIHKLPTVLKSGSYTNYAEKFRDISVPETSSFVEMDATQLNKNKRSIVKKTFLCWLLREHSPKLSSDRLIRVKAKIKKQSKIKMHCEYARQRKCGVKSY